MSVYGPLIYCNIQPLTEFKRDLKSPRQCCGKQTIFVSNRTIISLFRTLDVCLSCEKILDSIVQMDQREFQTIAQQDKPVERFSV